MERVLVLYLGLTEARPTRPRPGMRLCTGFPVAASDGPDRLPLPGGRVGSQRGRACRPRALAVPRQRSRLTDCPHVITQSATPGRLMTESLPMAREPRQALEARGDPRRTSTAAILDHMNARRWGQVWGIGKKRRVLRTRGLATMARGPAALVFYSSFLPACGDCVDTRSMRSVRP